MMVPADVRTPVNKKKGFNTTKDISVAHHLNIMLFEIQMEFETTLDFSNYDFYT